MSETIKRIVVFGGAGYLGSILSERLAEEGYDVTIYDRLSYGREPIAALTGSGRCRLIQADIRDAKGVVQAVREHDGVILAAALVGEAACAREIEETISINVLGSLNVLEACRRYGTSRFIFASTDSCYGIQTGIITELNPLRPASLYAQTKQLVEERILTAWKEDRLTPSACTGEPPGFGPVILRMGTLYGLSHRMRFDLALNLLTWRACTGQTILIYGGEQWRPMVHVRDAAEAYLAVLQARPALVLGQVFNVGSNEQNIQLKDLGRVLAAEFPEVATERVAQPPDLRDYHVDCSKITQVLGWRAQRTLEDGIREIRDAIASGRFGQTLSPVHQNA